jgi:hypothetical protein
MKKILSAVLVAMVALVSVTTAQAIEDKTFITLGYGSASLSNAGSFTNPSAFIIGVGGKKFATKGDSTIMFGYEADYVSLADSKFTSTAGSETLTQNSLQASVLAGMSVGAGFSVNGKLGLSGNYAGLDGTGAYTNNKGNAYTVGLVYGISAEYAISKSFSASVNWESLGNFKTASTLSGAGMTNIDITLMSARINYLF